MNKPKGGIMMPAHMLDPEAGQSIPPSPTVETIAYAIWDLVDQVPGEVILNALASVAGGVIVNISDGILEAHQIAEKFGTAARDSMRANWARAMEAGQKHGGP